MLAILYWQLGDDYNAHKDKKISEIQALFIKNAGKYPPEMLLPPNPEVPQVPQIEDTELGRFKRKQFQDMLKNSTTCSNEELQMLSSTITNLMTERNLNTV
jgi:hypothetical protein